MTSEVVKIKKLIKVGELYLKEITLHKSWDEDGCYLEEVTLTPSRGHAKEWVSVEGNISHTVFGDILYILDEHRIEYKVVTVKTTITVVEEIN